MSRDYLQNLLERYQSGNCSDEEREIVEAWYDTLDKKYDLPEIGAEELESVRDRILAHIITKSAHPSKKEIEPINRARAVRLWPKFVAAAAVVGIVICAALFINVSYKHSYFTQQERIAAIDKPVIKENLTDSLMTVVLEDGSRITLHAGAKITYPTAFEKDRREVVLSGEAFFEVSKNADSPFYVFSNSLITKVIGTSFYVRSGDSKESEVEVVTGKVMVTANNQSIFATDANKEVYITPNQKVIFDEDSKKLVPAIVDNPKPLMSAQAIVEFGFNYKNVQLQQVLNDIESTYGINIIPDDSKIYNCTFTGDLNDENMYSKLDLICQSTGMSYEVNNLSIIIKGNACSL
ncbi:ferric-dicitrate binding protein FerR (iron transport regulator) [Algoriphagus sp. 4150]|uniref:FecR family protein n=1 Tax=Algoriphagus sp. 4150 TaxID=2817756 RepID=UPI00285AFB1A|nr:FecR family protein [Algoriphagus sp. 4150]MDR7131933.1 ferric-dicitrate binding protein FerR (iron transport regulator) [Algoriphagus sp. 4150]